MSRPSRPPSWHVSLALLLALGAPACSNSYDVAGPPGDGGGTDAGGADAGGADAGGTDAGRDAGRDAGGTDAGATDAGATDAGRDAGRDSGPPVDSGTDTGTGADAGTDTGSGPVCGGMTRGSCSAAGLSCECCPAGGPLERCLCTTTCTSNADCTDAARPFCNKPMFGGGAGICTSIDFACAWGAVCAAPDTPIATPDGERAIATLTVGDLVYSAHEGELTVVPIRAVDHRVVTDHVVMHVTLASGRELFISPGHPTADGRLFADLAAGDDLGGVTVAAVERVPYTHEATYDILPDSDSGTYVAAGALVGSTLR